MKTQKITISLIVFLGLLMLTACDSCDGVVNYQVNGTLEIQTVDCEVVIPGRVKVSAEVFNQNNSVGASGTFGSNGPFNLTIPWQNNLGKPEWWRITSVTNIDGSDICTRENTCDEGEICLDMTPKVRRAPLNSPINWRIGCKCMKQS